MNKFLFEISSFSITSEGISLRPGVSLDKVEDETIGNLRQGSVIELDLRGHRVPAVVEHYFVEGIEDNETHDISFENRIVLVINVDFEPYVSAGVRVFLQE